MTDEFLGLRKVAEQTVIRGVRMPLDARTVLALLDRVEKSEQELGRYDRRLEKTENEYNRLETSHSILEQALQRVRELHERTSFEVERRAYCAHCQLVAGVWPCPTIRALEGDE